MRITGSPPARLGLCDRCCLQLCMHRGVCRQEAVDVQVVHASLEWYEAAQMAA